MPDKGLKSRIAAPLTSMLETLSTKSAKPRKSIVRVGSGGRNKAESVSKHKSDIVDGDDGCSGDFDVTFQVTRWRSKHCSSKRTVAFDCVSEGDHEKPIPVVLD